MQNIKRWISLALVVCLLAMSPAAALAEDTETGTGLPVESESITFPSPSASAAAAESETVTSPSPSASAAAESETITSPSPSIEASVSPSPSAETSPAPVETATKTIASFEALTPELFVPQGTPETGLSLPASLSVQFADGAAGEVAVAWQCAAGYDPNAEAGAQFAFVAVLPQGYALAEGVSLPQILVTLTPPLANAMLMADGIVDSGDGWMLSEDGKLTVTDKYVTSSAISSWNDVTSIEVAENASFTLNEGMSFSSSITVKADGELENSAGGTLSGNITLQGGSLNNYGALSGSVTVKAGGALNNGIGATSPRSPWTSSPRRRRPAAPSRRP